MKFKVHVNPDVASTGVGILGSSIGEYGLPDSSFVLEHSYIVTVRVPGENMIVKRYGLHTHTVGNRGRFILKSAGRVVFETAMEFARRGVPTPEPLFYVENRVLGLVTRSYYACRYYDGSTLDLAPKDSADFKAALQAFRSKLQSLGAKVPDKSIIFNRTEGGDYVFSVVNVENCRALPQN